MQTMPSKTRTVVALGAVVVALAVVAFALWSGRTDKNAMPEDQTGDIGLTVDQSKPASAIPTDTSSTTGGTQTTTSPNTSNSATATTPNTSTPVAGQVPAVHRVAEGDTLSKISEKYFGSATYYGFIEQMNPDLEDPDMLPVGKDLKMPKFEEVKGTAQ